MVLAIVLQLWGQSWAQNPAVPTPALASMLSGCVKSTFGSSRLSWTSLVSFFHKNFYCKRWTIWLVWLYITGVMRGLGTISHLPPSHNGNRDSPMPARDPHPHLPGTKCLPGTSSGTVRISIAWWHLLWCDVYRTHSHIQDHSTIRIYLLLHTVCSAITKCVYPAFQSGVLKDPGLWSLSPTLTCCVNLKQFLNFSEPQFSSRM